MNSRAVAATIIANIINKGTKLDTELNNITDDKPFVQALSYGVCRYYFRLLPLATKLLQKPFPEKNNDILALVLIGFYQLIYLDTKPFAAVNECVSAAKQLGKPWATGVINAVLRKFQRKQTLLLEEIDRDAAARFAHPQWFVEILQTAYPDNWETILQHNNQQPPMTLHINQQKIDRDDYLIKLQENNILANACEFSQVGVNLQTPTAVTQLPGFAEGEFSVQDEAAQLAANLLDIQPGHYVLDACAAPGGKTCHILETESEVELLALDNNEARCIRIQENLQRLQLTTTVLTADATTPETWWDGQFFDRILLDAPCSATGVIRRHPDIKLLRQAKNIDALNVTQYTMLEKLWAILKPGGILLYATCSILPQENTKIIKRFLYEHNDAKELKIDAKWGKADRAGRQILPATMDGFYYAKLSKAV